MAVLREFMFERVYLGAAARREHSRIERVLRTLFEHYAADPALVPDGGGAPGDSEDGTAASVQVAGEDDQPVELPVEVGFGDGRPKP